MTDGKERLRKAVSDLAQAFALSVPHDEALRIRDDLAFFQDVNSRLNVRDSLDDPTRVDVPRVP